MAVNYHSDLGPSSMALSPFFSGYLGLERYLSGPYNLQRVEPHKNIELMNLSLSLPPYMTYRNGQTKYFAREAMHGLLPEEIRAQPRVGKLTSIVMRSFLKNRKEVREKVLEDPSSWNLYVRESWMRGALKRDAALDSRDLFVVWLCLHMGPWLKAIKPRGELYSP